MGTVLEGDGDRLTVTGAKHFVSGVEAVDDLMVWCRHANLAARVAARADAGSLPARPAVPANPVTAVAMARAAVGDLCRQVRAAGLELGGASVVRAGSALGAVLRDCEAGVIMPPSTRRSERVLGADALGQAIRLLDAS